MTSQIQRDSRQNLLFSRHLSPANLLRRRRQWVVTDISQSRSSSKQTKIEHLVTLTSINDEDDIDESLQVVWEIEPGAKVIEKAGLPNITGFDEPERLDAS